MMIYNIQRGGHTPQSRVRSKIGVNERVTWISFKIRVQIINGTEYPVMAMLATSMRCPYRSCMHNTLGRNNELLEYEGWEENWRIPSTKATHTFQIRMHSEIFVPRYI